MTLHIQFKSLKNEKPIKIVWATDLHLDATDKIKLKFFLDQILSIAPDLILLSGDISNGVNSLSLLVNLQKILKTPIYFVLGNHDYYHGSIKAIREQAHEKSLTDHQIFYLTDRRHTELTAATALLGHDGWADGRTGDFFNSDISLHDYFLIEDLKHLNPKKLLEKLHSLGKEAGDYFMDALPKAFETHDRVLIVTHPPPFREACVYEGNPSDDNWSPHFVCQAVGDALLDICKKFPHKEALVFCGHSHSPADVQILPNLRVIAGETTLGEPHVQGIIEIK